MACAQIVKDGAVVGHLCGGGTVTPMTRRPLRFWCFKCRKRHLHRAFLLDSGPYYDLEVLWKCDGCAEDNRRFPGF